MTAPLSPAEIDELARCNRNEIALYQRHVDAQAAELAIARATIARLTAPLPGELAEIEARANAATPDLTSGDFGCGCCGTASAADTRFVDDARTDVPRLLAEVRRLRAMLAPIVRDEKDLDP